MATATKRKALTADEKDARLAEAQEMLLAAVEQITTSEDWIRYLQFAKGFYTYSFNNVMLMWAQQMQRGMKPLTQVAGFRHWLTLNRGVRKGEKGLKIYAPIIVKIKEGEPGFPGSKLVGFRITTVFDAQQTDGEPLPVHPASTSVISGDLDSRGALTALGDHAAAIGFPWRYGDSGRAEGHTDSLAKEIVISTRHEDDEARTFAILAHEVAHATLHTEDDYDYRGHRGVAETEAESVAYLVSEYFGVDMADTSFHYVAGWAQDAEVVMKTGQRVMKTAKDIIAVIEKF